MKRLVLIFVLCHFASIPALATFEVEDPVQSIDELRAAKAAESPYNRADMIALDKRDYLKLIVGTYVNGFNEFDTSIWTSNEHVKVGIYYAPERQDMGRAELLADQFREQLPLLLAEPQYQWASNVEIEVSVYQVSGSVD